MPKTELSKTLRTVIVVLAIAVVATILVIAGLLLQEHGPGNMGLGLMQGGLVALIAFAIVIWRSTKRPQRATMFERAITQTGDERDDAVLTRAFAVVGAFALPLAGVAAVTVALGALAEMVFTLLMVAYLVVGTTAFIVINRRS